MEITATQLYSLIQLAELRNGADDGYDGADMALKNHVLSLSPKALLEALAIMELGRGDHVDSWESAMEAARNKQSYAASDLMAKGFPTPLYFINGLDKLLSKF